MLVRCRIDRVLLLAGIVGADASPAAPDEPRREKAARCNRSRILASCACDSEIDARRLGIKLLC